MDEYYEDDDYSLDDNNFNVGISKEQILNFFIYKIGELLRKRRKKIDEFKMKNNIQKNIQNLSINEGKIIYQSLKEFFEIKNNNIEIAKDIINSLSNQNENLLIKNLKLLYTKKKYMKLIIFFAEKIKVLSLVNYFIKGEIPESQLKINISEIKNLNSNEIEKLKFCILNKINFEYLNIIKELKLPNEIYSILKGNYLIELFVSLIQNECGQLFIDFFNISELLNLIQDLFVIFQNIKFENSNIKNMYYDIKQGIESLNDKISEQESFKNFLFNVKNSKNYSHNFKLIFLNTMKQTNNPLNNIKLFLFCYLEDEYFKPKNINQNIINKIKNDIIIIKKEDNDKLLQEQIKSLRTEEQIQKILEYRDSAKELITYFCNNLDIPVHENAEINLRNIYKKVNEKNNDKNNYYYEILTHKKDGLSFLEYLLELIKRGDKYSKTAEETFDSEN
jgi:hypothetical protein